MNLQLWLKMGLQLISIKRVLGFKQEPFIADFIASCTDRRAAFTSKVWETIIKNVSNTLKRKTVQLYSTSLLLLGIKYQLWKIHTGTLTFIT